MHKILTLSLILLFGVAVSACQSQPKKDEIAEIEEWNPTGLSVEEGGESILSVSGLSEDDSGDTLAGVVIEEDFGDSLSKRVVYFEYDSNVLTSEGNRIVEAHAEYVATNLGMALVLEGHADERGTREYNLSLGESRAKAVAEIFLELGVSENAIRIISYGEERPVDFNQNEDSWSLNRRVEILY